MFRKKIKNVIEVISLKIKKLKRALIVLISWEKSSI